MHGGHGTEARRHASAEYGQCGKQEGRVLYLLIYSDFLIKLPSIDYIISTQLLYISTTQRSPMSNHWHCPNVISPFQPLLHSLLLYPHCLLSHNMVTGHSLDMDTWVHTPCGDPCQVRSSGEWSRYNHVKDTFNLMTNNFYTLSAHGHETHQKNQIVVWT